MRYKIINGDIEESMFIDAPYDSWSDAMHDKENGIDHNCEKCVLGSCSTQDALQKHNARQRLIGKIIGE